MENHVTAKQKRWRRSIPRSTACIAIALSWLALNLSCLNTSPEDEAGAGSGAAFHPAGWAGPQDHGQSYLNARDSCATSCHGNDLSGGFTGIACTKCHADFPHPAGWNEPAAHGEASRKAGALDRCTDCHGKDFQGGTTGVGCLTCHALYPHPSSWLNPQVHGGPVLDAGNASGCATTCHGTDFLGGLSGESCFTCHQGYPHGPSWASFDRHGAVAKAQGSVSCASLCHGTSFLGGDTGISCYACHGPYPHTGWSPYGTHYGWVRAFGETGCLTAQGCHNDFRGPVFNPPPDCTSFCHRPGGF